MCCVISARLSVAGSAKPKSLYTRPEMRVPEGLQGGYPAIDRAVETVHATHPKIDLWQQEIDVGGQVRQVVSRQWRKGR
jgi:hypothetical protein